METQHKPGVLFRFRQSTSVPKRQPSRALTEALRQFAGSEEMRPFIAKAHRLGRDVVIEVFHAREGHPLLIHIAAAPTRQASEAESR